MADEEEEEEETEEGKPFKGKLTATSGILFWTSSTGTGRSLGTDKEEEVEVSAALRVVSLEIVWSGHLVSS